MQGLPQFLIYKVRVKNASAKSGKSGGFRVIYYLKKETAIYIISVYSKSEKSNITTQEIIDILGGAGLV